MPFDPRDFLELAEHLNGREDFPASLDDAVTRTIVGRCYYGAFLMVREHFRNLFRATTISTNFEEMVSQNAPEVHGVVKDMLSILRLESGELLRSLRDDRNIADYRLEGSIDHEESLALVRSLVNDPLPNDTILDQKIRAVTKIIGEYHERFRNRQLGRN